MKKLTVQDQLNNGGFKQIPNKKNYYANQKGEVASTFGGRFTILKQCSNGAGDGYWFVKIDGPTKPVYIHRIVWETFVGPIPKGYDIHHKNSTPSDNRLENLECIEKGRHASITNKGRKRTEQAKKRISEGIKKYWEKKKNENN